MKQTRFGVQVAFGILFLGIALVVLLSAIWIGLGFANRLVVADPPADRRRQGGRRGQSRGRGAPRNSDGDLGALGVDLQHDDRQLRSQRDELLAANDQIDSRRRFTEAVLSGVTAGVIGLDGEGRVTLVNRTALRISALPARARSARPIAEIVPPAWRRSSAARCATSRPEHRDQITLTRGGRERTFNVQVTTSAPTGQAHGYVVTLDDITDLVAAQRSSAWADVARRIAHEIKNPLTPIQLSAERLKRNFGKVDHRGPRGLRPVHRHHRPPGRRHRPHGRRVLVLRAHAEADHRDRRPVRGDPRGGLPARGRPAGHRLQASSCRRSRCSAASTPA